MTTTKSKRNSWYAILALYRKKVRGSYTYEWKELRVAATKKGAIDQAKIWSKVSYRDGNTGRYMIQKQTNECFVEDGKIVE